MPFEEVNPSRTSLFLSRRPERLGMDSPEADAPLLAIGPHCAGWEEPDLGVLCLVALERTMMPLLAALFPPKPHGREHAVELLIALLPAIVAPLEVAVAGGTPKVKLMD